ncbi:hypothetical protein ACLK2I_00755 [Escherichia coli]
MPVELAKLITEALAIPVIGIGEATSRTGILVSTTRSALPAVRSQLRQKFPRRKGLHRRGGGGSIWLKWSPAFTRAKNTVSIKE